MRGMIKIGRLAVVGLVAASLANCAGRSEKQIEVQKRPATTPSAQPLPASDPFIPAVDPGGVGPDTAVVPVGTVVTPVVGATPLPATTPIAAVPVGTVPVVSPVSPSTPSTPVTPSTPSTPVTPGTPVTGGTTSATITISMGGGATQQVQWDGLSDQGNAKWKIESVSN